MTEGSGDVFADLNVDPIVAAGLKERAHVVVWLRRIKQFDAFTLKTLADAIERGDHHNATAQRVTEPA